MRYVDGDILNNIYCVLYITIGFSAWNCELGFSEVPVTHLMYSKSFNKSSACFEKII